MLPSSTITDPPAPRSSWFASMVRWAAFLLVLAAVVGIAYLALEQRQLGPAASPTATPVEELLHLDLGRLEVDHPSNWRYHEFQESFSFFSSLGYLTPGKFDPDAICTRTSTTDATGAAVAGLSRKFSGHPVEPSGVIVMFGAGSWGDGFSATPGETQATVGGMPAYVSETKVGDILTLKWRVRMPGTRDNWWEIEATMREHGADESRRQVEAIIASLRFDPPPTILPTSGAEFDRGAAEAARRALDTVRSPTQQDAAGYSCFVSERGVLRTAEVSVVPQNRPLSEPLQVTCTTLVEADADMWRVRFVMEWTATDGHGAGRLETEVWVTAGGEAGHLGGSGDDPP